MGEAPQWLTNLVAVVILAAWVVTIAVGALSKDWTGATITTPVMLGLAGYAFGLKIIQKQKERA